LKSSTVTSCSAAAWARVDLEAEKSSTAWSRQAPTNTRM
jgi:hypothetical protein